MSRLPASLLAVALPLAVISAPAALQARDSAVFYSAELASPAQDERVIAGGVVFHCAETRCVAREGRERPLRVCSELRRKVGTITEFSTGDSALPADHLERCNG